MIIMNRIKIFSLAAAFSLTLTAFPMLVHGDEAVYNPEDDPLVSLSYITEIVTPAYDKKIEELNDTITTLTETLTELYEKLSEYELIIENLEARLDEEEPADESAANHFEVVYLNKGAKIMAESPCEIVLRSGSAIVVSIVANGLSDMTDGTELLNTANIPLNHHLLVPRGGDGRGIEITSEEAYIMVRGDYSVVE